MSVTAEKQKKRTTNPAKRVEVLQREISRRQEKLAAIEPRSSSWRRASTKPS